MGRSIRVSMRMEVRLSERVGVGVMIDEWSV